MMVRISLSGLALVIIAVVLVAIAQVLALPQSVFTAAGVLMVIGVCVAFGALLVRMWEKQP